MFWGFKNLTDKKRFWQHTIPVETTVEELTYYCPDCGEKILSIPCGFTIPEETKIVKCSKGHDVIVPNFGGK